MSIVKELEGKIKRIECMEADMATLQSAFDAYKVEAEANLVKVQEESQALIVAKDEEIAKLNEALVAKDAEVVELAKVEAEKSVELDNIKNVLKNPAFEDAKAGANIEEEHIKAGYIEEEEVKEVEKTHCEIFDSLTGVAKTKYYQDHKEEILKELGSKVSK